MTAKRTRRALGGSTPAEKVSLGRSLAVRPGRSPGEDLSKGATLAARYATGGTAKKKGGKVHLHTPIIQTGPHCGTLSTSKVSRKHRSR